MKDRPDGPLAHRPYRFYLASRAATTLGSQLQVVAVGWQMYELTGSALALGLVGLVQFLPSLLLVFVAGAAVDRFDRRAILIACRIVQTLAALALAGASRAGTLDQATVYGFVTVLGIARAFEMPASQALISRLVPGALLSRAVALSSTVNQAATIAGPAIGGLLYVAGADVAYATAGALFAGAALMLASIAPGGRGERQPLSVDYLFGGIRFIAGHPVLLGAISLDMVAVLLGGATALLPIYAKDILHTGPWGLGLLRSAPAIGALAVAAWLARHPVEHRVGPLLLGSVALFGVATLVFGVSRWLPLSVAALVMLGAADMVSVVIRLTLMQLETPDAMRGRVGAVNALFVGASNQIGEFESGLTAAWLGTVPSVVLGGLGTLAVVAAWRRLFPALARRDRMTRADDG